MHILKAFLLVKIIIKLIYNMDLYRAFFLQKSLYYCLYVLKITVFVVLQPKIGR